jgi:hypothetical protein
MNPINFFERLCEQLFDTKHEIVFNSMDYNLITCLCGGTYIKDYQQGFKFCNKCGLTDMLLEYVPEHSYENGPYTRNNYHPYKRSNHLNERLSEFTNQNFKKPIPRAIYNLILRKYQKKEQITPNLIRNVLKQNKLPQYYKAVNIIYRRCTGKTMSHITGSEISKISYLFSEVEYIFNQIKPSTRKAFLNYNFVICKLLQRIGRDDCIEYFKQIKSSKRKLFHVEMWKQIEIKLPECNYAIVA